jgi:hypothetical protein
LVSDGQVPCEGILAMMRVGMTNLDLEIQCRAKGDDIVIYLMFKVTKVAGIKCKYREDYDPIFSN